MDRHHHPSALRHHHSRPGIRDSFGIDGGYPARRRPRTRGQTGIRTGRPLTRNLLPYQDVGRGDIIVFRWPGDIRQNYVKRVVGIAGDRLHLENKQLSRNGVLLNEPYAVHRTDYIDSYRDNFPAAPSSSLPPAALAMLGNNVTNGNVVVPSGCYFAMGDNRDLSSDSRFWGFVPRENIIGKPLLIYWSYEASTEDLSDPGISIPHLIDMAIHFPTKTRWSRTLRLIRP